MADDKIDDPSRQPARPAMESAPPPTPPQKDFRRAFALNLFLPGAGQLYLGQRWSGLILAGTFLLCLLAALVIFLTGYAHYLSVTLNGNILEGNQLEKLGDSFHPRWLLALMVVGIVIFVAGLIGLACARRSMEKK